MPQEIMAEEIVTTKEMMAVEVVEEETEGEMDGDNRSHTSVAVAVVGLCLK